ncbi:MAG: FtsX-like permease family protein [Gammaproteobacteria bacterium]|nr:FtsX-like permease family protein [Gammaproteobacteria bacterium]
MRTVWLRDFFSRWMVLVFIAWRNIWRNQVRSLLTVSALAGSLVIVILYSALLEGMTRQMAQFATEISTGDLQIHRKEFRDDQDLYATIPVSYLDKLEKRFPTLNFSPRMYAAALASSGEISTGVSIKAVDPVREPQVTNILQHIREGSLNLAMDASGYFNVLLGAQLAKSMAVVPGSEMILVTQAADGSIGNALFRVAGIIKPVEPNFDRMGVLMSIDAYQQLMVMQPGFHELVVKVGDSHSLMVAQQQINAAIAALSLADPAHAETDLLVETWRQLTPAVADMLDLSKVMVWIVGAIVVSLASLGMLNTMLMAVYERSHEFGILLAIGMKARVLMVMVLLESLFLASIATLVGVVIGSGLATYLQTHGIDFSSSMPDGYDWGGMVFEPVMRGHLEFSQVVIASVLMLVIAMLSSLLPVWRAIRLKPAQDIR